MNPNELLSEIIKIKKNTPEIKTITLWMSTAPFVRHFLVNFEIYLDLKNIEYQPIKRTRSEVMIKDLKLQFYNQSNEPRFQGFNEFSFIDEKVYDHQAIQVIKMRSNQTNETTFSLS